MRTRLSRRRHESGGNQQCGLAALRNAGAGPRARCPDGASAKARPSAYATTPTMGDHEGAQNAGCTSLSMPTHGRRRQAAQVRPAMTLAEGGNMRAEILPCRYLALHAQRIDSSSSELEAQADWRRGRRSTATFADAPQAS